MTDRSTALQLVLLLAVASAPLSAETLRVSQGSNSWEVRALHDVIRYDLTESVADPAALAPSLADLDSPLDTGMDVLSDGTLRFYKLDEQGRDVASFYGYSSTFPSSASSSLSKPDTTRVFLHFDDSTGGISLVVVLDAPNDGDGGQADMTVTGLPATAFWSVEDDPAEGFTMDTVSGVATASWNWLDCCTDGGAISGLEGQDLTLGLDFTWRLANGGTITGLEFLSGTGQSIDDFSSIVLDPSQPFSIELSGSDQPASFEVLLSVHKNLSLDSPRLAWKDLDRIVPSVDPSVVPLAVRSCIVADGITPGRVVVTPRDPTGTPLGTGLDIAADDSALAPGRLEGPLRDLRSGRYIQEVVADQLGMGFLGFVVEGTPLSQAVPLLFVASRPEAEVLLRSSEPFQVGDLICFEAGASGGQGGVRFAWDFDADGTVDSRGRFPCHRYTAAGTYRVILEVEDAQPCYDRAVRTLEIVER